MADEALVVPHVICSFSGGEVDPVNVHGVGASGKSGIPSRLGQWNVAISSTSEFPKLYHILVELPDLIEPLFPFPASLFLPFWESSGSHHDGKLVGYSLLKGIHQDAIKIDSAACLG